MAKINELNNKQLLMSVVKYKKILDQLLAERDKRLSAGMPEAELLTPEEIKEKEEQRTHEAQLEQFSLNLGDDDIEAIETLKKEEESKDDDEDELVRVTTLLRLSKEQLAELNKAKQEQKKSNQVAKRPKGKKVSSLSASKGRIKIKK